MHRGMSMDLDTTQVLGVVGLVVASFIAGRFSNQLNCCRRNVVNAAKSSRRQSDVSQKGKYSKKFYNNQLEHTKLVS